MTCPKWHRVGKRELRRRGEGSWRPPTARPTLVSRPQFLLRPSATCSHKEPPPPTHTPIRGLAPSRAARLEATSTCYTPPGSRRPLLAGTSNGGPGALRGLRPRGGGRRALDHAEAPGLRPTPAERKAEPVSFPARRPSPPLWLPAATPFPSGDPREEKRRQRRWGGSPESTRAVAARPSATDLPSALERVLENPRGHFQEPAAAQGAPFSAARAVLRTAGRRGGGGRDGAADSCHNK